MYSRQNQIFLIPQTYLEQFSTLPFEYIGMPLGRWIDQIFEPSHAFITRFGHQFNKGIILIEDALIQQWIAGRDIRHPETEIKPQGQFLMVTDRHGRNLGLGRLLPKRLRNMLPRQYF
jgi:NOL1/NOP2/fmu family ribosome biogenesis protein